MAARPEAADGEPVTITSPGAGPRARKRPPGRLV
jgi:hypothetical protein